ncbi:MAG: hypothetical protein WBD74_02500 [Candidatus Aquilonibacter sp.]
MSAQPLDVRLLALEASMERRFDTIDRKIDGNLKTIISWMLGQTAVIVGALAAVAFALHH